MAVRSASQGILADENTERRERVLELLTKAYWMELETVISYLASSVNPDGVRAQEIREALASDIEEELGHARCSRAGSRSFTVSCPARSSSGRSSRFFSRPPSRPTSSA
jgi:bacterioferritin